MAPRLDTTRITALAAITLSVMLGAVQFSPATIVMALSQVPHSGIYITSDAGFTQANGVVSGNGTVANPFVIEGWQITTSPGISIRYTSAFFIVRNVTLNGAGVYLLYVSNGQLLNDTISDSGVTIESSNSDVLAHSTISASVGEGLHIIDSKNVNVTGNVISGSKYSAVDLQGYSSLNIVLSGNKLSGNGGDGLDANSSNLTIFNNTISSNGGLGISLQFDGNINVTANTILHNGSTGIGLTSPAGTVRTYHNNFAMNKRVQTYTTEPQAYTTGGIWDDGYPDGGNYWSDYSGVDNCRGQMQNICNNPDGIGDTPYAINFIDRDNFPLMEPWGYSDSLGPSWPASSSLTAQLTSQFSLTLVWTSALDAYWVANYRVYENGGMIAQLSGTTQSYTVNGLLPGTAYLFNVEASNAWNNWTRNGPSLNATTVDIPPLPPPQHGAFMFYRLRYSHQATEEQPFLLVNQFWNLGDTPVRIVSVSLQSDFGTYNLFSASSQYPTVCGQTYAGALNIGVSSGQTLNKTVRVPSAATIGNHTFVARVAWQYQGQVQIYPNNPPVTLWCDTSPVSLKGWLQVGPGPNSTPGPNPTKNPSTPAFISSILSGIQAIFPLAIAAFSIIVATALILVLRYGAKSRRQDTLS